MAERPADRSMDASLSDMKMGMQESAHWARLYTSSDCAAGIRALGMEQMLKTRFGRMTSAVFPATSKETSKGMVGGYRIGAGSNVLGSDIGIHDEGRRCR